jgi:cysteinyl-tRNA synthetase
MQLISSSRKRAKLIRRQQFLSLYPKEDALASIDLLLSKRLKAKKKQNYREADGFREQLMAEFGVYVDDKRNVRSAHTLFLASVSCSWKNKGTDPRSSGVDR